MKSNTPLSLGTLLFIISCNVNTQQPVNVYHPEIVPAIGHVIPADSLEPPIVVPAGKPDIVMAGKPKIVRTNSNVHKAGRPIIYPADDFVVSTPGVNGLALPDTVVAITHPVLAGIPEVSEAKEADTRDKNPQNFSFYGRHQGMQTDGFISIAEDNDGNLWFSSMGRGVMKYDGNNFINYTEKQGLIIDYVLYMLKDRKGNMWFGSLSKGIVRFDGKYFTTYTEKEGLSEDRISDIIEDKDGNIWISTFSNGLNKFDGKNFIHYTRRQGLPSDSVRTLSQDHHGNVWIDFYDKIVKFDGKSFHRLQFEKTFPRSNTHTVFVDRSDNIWIGSTAGLCKYDGKNYTNYVKSDGLLDNIPTVCCQDKNGNLWIRYSGSGVTSFDGKTFVHYTENEGFSNAELRDVFEDRSGNIWFATNGGGINKFGGKTFIHYTKREGLPSALITDFEERQGDLWMSTSNGIIKYDGNTFTCFTGGSGIITELVWCMIKGKNQRLWMGTLRGVSMYDGKKFENFTRKQGLYDEDNHCLFEDSKGIMWMGTATSLTRYDGKTFTHYTEKSGLGRGLFIVKDIHEDKKGNLWIGTATGLKKFDGKKFTHYTIKEDRAYNVILDVAEDNAGNIWLCTKRGVVRYDGKSFWIFGEKEGLLNSKVNCIIDDNENYWFGLEDGLSKLNKKAFDSFEKSTNKTPESASRLFKTYTYEDGLSGFGVGTATTATKSRDGIMWMASNGLTAFRPDEMKSDATAPVMQLTNVALFDEKIPWQYLLNDNQAKDTTFVTGNGVSVHDVAFNNTSNWYGIPQNLSLPYDNNDITLEYAGITMHSPKKVRYQYMLEGLDHQWSSLTNRKQVTYGNLPYGLYTFKVKAMNDDGYWSKEFNYPFTIRPPWWHTWWAYILFVLMFAGMLYGLFRYRLNQVRNAHEIKHKTAALEMKALRAQMNPHFIFNSLNSINLFIMENNRLQASEYLAIFSRLVRLILNNSRETFIPLTQELEALQLYLELESLRFENKFNYTINVDDEIDTTSTKVPPLIIQPYVENAIWHGLMPKKEAGNLEIALYFRNNILHCKITDDGIGRKKAAEFKSKMPSKGKSMGMHITSDRIAMLQDQRSDSGIFITDLVLPDGSAAGTEILIKIPVTYD